MDGEIKRLEVELARAREDALGDFFQDMLDKNHSVGEVLLGAGSGVDIALAGLVEYFRQQGLRPWLTPGRLGKRLKLDHKSRDYRPLDFAFSGDGEVEAEVAHPGLAYRGRVLVLPGVRRVPDQIPDK